MDDSAERLTTPAATAADAIAMAEARLEAAASLLAASLLGDENFPLAVAAQGAVRLIDRARVDLERAKR